MRINKILPIAVAVLGLCKSGSTVAIDNNTYLETFTNSTDFEKRSTYHYTRYTAEQLKYYQHASNGAIILNKNGTPKIPVYYGSDCSKEKKEKYPEECVAVYCGDNTTDCNIGFKGDSVISMYGMPWEIQSPRATVMETFRKKKNDYEEIVSVVTTIRNYNTFYPVYIYGKLDSGSCFNDKGNKCTLDTFLNQPSNYFDSILTLKNIEDKSIKKGRFRYTDITGRCYKTWALTFDVQATKEDIKKWPLYQSINPELYED